jgi:hypothetical protein
LKKLNAEALSDILVAKTVYDNDVNDLARVMCLFFKLEIELEKEMGQEPYIVW